MTGWSRSTAPARQPPRFFTDYLTLARLGEGWIIVGKTFHTDTH
jgi:hypothetical protein